MGTLAKHAAYGYGGGWVKDSVQTVSWGEADEVYSLWEVKLFPRQLLHLTKHAPEQDIEKQ